MSMSSSEIHTHQFTDDVIDGAERDVDGTVFLDLGWERQYVTLSKEDLLHLLKLIEETN